MTTAVDYLERARAERLAREQEAIEQADRLRAGQIQAEVDRAEDERKADVVRAQTRREDAAKARALRAQMAVWEASWTHPTIETQRTLEIAARLGLTDLVRGEMLNLAPLRLSAMGLFKGGSMLASVANAPLQERLAGQLDAIIAAGERP